MADFKMCVTEIGTGERIRDEECDMCVAICINREELKKTERRQEEVLASSISLLGPVRAPYVLTTISSTAEAINALVGRAVERVAPIEWATRRDGLETVRDKLKVAVEQVEVLCAMADAVREV